MRIYLASGFNHRAHLLKEVVPWLEGAGHVVSSRWLQVEPGVSSIGETDLASHPEAIEDARKAALVDLRDIDTSELFALFTAGRSTTGGCHTEYGYALAHRHMIAIVGPLLNVFHVTRSPLVTHYPTESAFLSDHSSHYRVALEQTREKAKAPAALT